MEVDEMNSQIILQLKELILPKLDYYTGEKNPLFKHETSGAQVMIDKMNEVSSLIKQSCIERQEKEGNNYFVLTTKIVGFSGGQCGFSIRSLATRNMNRDLLIYAKFISKIRKF
jgi:hypothetical protein